MTDARPPLWRSPRFALGLALIAGAIALGGWAVDRAAGGEALLVARGDLIPGQVLTAQDVQWVRTSWDGASGTYLDELPSDAVVTSFVGAGELLPASAVGAAADGAGRPLALALPVGSQAGPGDLVDLWVVREVAEGAAAELLVPDVLVTAVEDDAGLLRSGSGKVVRVQVPPEVVAQVLEAQAVGDTLTIVERAGG